MSGLISFFRPGRARRRAQQAAFIGAYEFPGALRDRLREHHPELRNSEVDAILEGLREWFLLCLYADGQMIRMPSRAADEAWHEFILLTPMYHAFCDQAFGHYLHHSPEAIMDEPVQPAVARTLQVYDRQIATRRVPRLFELDEQLRWPAGMLYSGFLLEEWRAEPQRDRDDGRSWGWGGGGSSCSSGDGGGGSSCGGSGGGCGSSG
jgi:uncharacterized membrane protein YgcG